jgi:muramoyltetrapeptide carboxypeptidase LdcA involved in peptidoglycan recycling
MLRQYRCERDVRPDFRYPQKPVPGEAVAVLSPSGRSAARFPAPFDLGLRRLREELRLEPVEYPTTRAPAASPAERARDVHAAFADAEVKAVIAAIGGEDELKVLAHLDGDVLGANPQSRSSATATTRTCTCSSGTSASSPTTAAP